MWTRADLSETVEEHGGRGDTGGAQPAMENKWRPPPQTPAPQRGGEHGVNSGNGIRASVHSENQVTDTKVVVGWSGGQEAYRV